MNIISSSLVCFLCFLGVFLVVVVCVCVCGGGGYKKILYDMQFLIYVDLRNKIKYNNFKQRSIILRLYNGICDTSHNRKRSWRKRIKFDCSWTLLFMRCCTQPELCMNKAEKMIETRQSPWTGTRFPDN